MDASSRRNCNWGSPARSVSRKATRCPGTLRCSPAHRTAVAADDQRKNFRRRRASRFAFHATVDADVPIARTSLLRVRQIVTNLLSNAIKYMDAGSAVLRVRRRTLGPSGDSGDWIALEVADRGRGVAPDKLEFIFEEFGRIGDGEIAVVSEPRKGSTFTLWLPVVGEP